MKLTFVFIAVCFAFVAIHSQDPTTDEEDDDAAFIKYLKQYNKKNYTNLIEYLKRKLEFKKCFTRISKHNKNYDKGLVSFMLRENKFCDLFDSERQKLANGNRLPAYDFTDFQMNTKTVGTVSNTTYPPGPPSISWRAKKCVTPVKDQGYYCNCCWAFSAIASLESHWCIKTGQLIRMSEQQAIDCNRNEQTGNWGCDGGSPAAFYMYVYGNDGIQNDTTYPFQEDVEHSGSYACRYNGVNRIATTCGYWRVQRDEEVMKNVIAGKGPVSAAVCASLDSFYFYGYGIYDDTNCKNCTSHSVLVVGYGTSNGIDYWLCKNSWSTDWGENGYFRIRRGVNRCGIMNYLIFPDIC